MKRLAFGMAMLSLLLSGCQKSATREDGKLRVGLINTSRILEEMPKYRDLRNNLAQERGSFMASLPENPSKEEFDRVQKDAAKKQKDWEKRVMDTVQQSVKEISALTADVAKQKDLDLVVISTPYTNSIYYHAGQDITIDVLLKLQK